MKPVLIFLGPTLAVEQARHILDASYLPPACQGDVFRAVAATDAHAIGIVDGGFREAPSVWHKEILWAMSQGVHVLGAGSMGALRAAELANFGMLGEGRIFDAYRTGFLEPYTDPFEDDDEVAIVHGPGELGYPPLSEALVDIRCTLNLACRSGGISTASRDLLVRLAKGCFYAERNYETLIERAAGERCSSKELQWLRGWLPRGRISQKRLDALALLTRIARGEFILSKQVSFEFQHTTMWDRLTGEAFDGGTTAPDPRLAEEDGLVMAELRIRPDLFHEVKEEAERALRIGPCPPVRRVALAMLDVLRVRGMYAELAARSARKASWLAHHPAPRDGDLSGLQRLQLLDWYFEKRLKRAQPDDVGGFARSLGFCDRQTLVEALAQEYVFVVSDDGCTTG